MLPMRNLRKNCLQFQFPHSCTRRTHTIPRCFPEATAMSISEIAVNPSWCNQHWNENGKTLKLGSLAMFYSNTHYVLNYKAHTVWIVDAHMFCHFVLATLTCPRFTISRFKWSKRSKIKSATISNNQQQSAKHQVEFSISFRWHLVTGTSSGGAFHVLFAVPGHNGLVTHGCHCEACNLALIHKRLRWTKRLDKSRISVSKTAITGNL